MKALLLFFAGLLIGSLYFGHLYLQLQNLQKERKISLFFTFPVRFLLLSIVLGILFYRFDTLAIYSVFGVLICRFILYLKYKHL
ncbi:MAG: ATP synthase subunit I [Sulfurimonas sp.]